MLPSFLRNISTESWVAIFTALIALGALIISVCALVVTIQHARQTEADNYLARMPMVKVSLGTKEDGVSFAVENEGNGDAYINDLQLRVDGRNVQLSMLLTSLFGVGKEFTSHRFLVALPKVVPARSSIEIFRISESGSDARSDVQLMHEIALRMGVLIGSRPLGIDDERSLIDLQTLAKPSDQGFRATK